MSQVAPAGRILFGTDGIRGRANVAPMTPELALRLGQALAHTIAMPGRRARVVIGKDTRISGYVFETALASGVCSMGADVQLCGPLPTPGIAFVTASMRADAGVVISASHNPYFDNGIKIFGSDGFKLPDAKELELEALLHDEEFPHVRPQPSEIGKAIKIEDVRGRYIVFLKSIFPRERTLEGLRIVVDCAHGAAYRVAPAVLSELGADVIALHNAPDGFNINDDCGAVHPERMCQAVRQHKAHVGIALDGDADRVIIADEQGQVVDGDIIMAICAQWMVKRKELQKNTVVATVMSNLGLERALDGMGCQLLRTQVGDRYVVETMRAGGYNFGGEQSGHLVFLDFMTTGDGMLAALRLLAALLESGRPLSEMRQIMNRYPQVLVNVAVRQKRPLAEMPLVREVIEVVETRLGKEGRVLVRYSGTESKVRVMVEGPDETMISGYADEIVHALSLACSE